ncbi:MAG: hypothetical protein HYV34_01160 [Candidatus Kerfeldbacteria bacterium]|nr:hypothetical protein [Candidatus Kerfeldbacteria bacterium]
MTQSTEQAETTGDSILDRVISSKHDHEIQEFSPEEVISELLRNLSDKEEDILRRRHGLHGHERETLEVIGAVYNVTRERIRQIENSSIEAIRNLKGIHDQLRSIEHVIHTTLQAHGGAMAEDRLLDELLKFSAESLLAKRSLVFILSHLLQNKFVVIEPTETLRRSWRLPIASVEHIELTVKELCALIQEINESLPSEKVIEHFKQRPFYVDRQHQFTDDAILSSLGMSQEIDRNPYEEYGLRSWGSIRPKRMNDKIYLVLKKARKPLHFTEITDEINRVQFDTRKAYPPTIHNELILNDRYVLVGRGMYALTEWGYKPGVVSDVIREILLKSGPLSRDEIVKRVLEQRVVKKNTIHLALTHRDRFEKLADGRYGVQKMSA